MVLGIITTLVDAPEVGVAAEVDQVELGIIAANEPLEFLLVEHRKPHRLNHLAKAFEKGVCHNFGMVLESVAHKPIDIEETVCVCDWCVSTVLDQLSSF